MTNGSFMKVKSMQNAPIGAFCNTFDLHRVLTRILKTGVIESTPGKSWSQNGNIGL